MRRLALATFLVVGLAVPANAQSGDDEITRGDLDAAAAVRRDVAAELSSATALYEENIDRAAELEHLVSVLSIELAVQERQIAAAKVAARNVVREMYMSGGSLEMSLLFDTESFTDMPVRRGYLDLVSASDAATLNHLQAVEAGYADQLLVLEQAAAEQLLVTTDLEALATSILERLEAADADYRSLVSDFQAQEAEKARLAEIERLRILEEERLRKEAEAEAAAAAADAAAAAAAAAAATTTTDPGTASSTTSTTAPPATTTPPSPTTTAGPPPPPSLPAIDGRICPVDGPVSFVDSFGAGRSGGRKHEGVDMISPRGTPLVAIESGTVKRMRNGGLGGITVWLRGEGGDEFYYAHLDAWADGLSKGDHLDAGELLGYVGNTGNARYTIPHLHFEYHPDGGKAVNPYPLAAELCL